MHFAHSVAHRLHDQRHALLSVEAGHVPPCTMACMRAKTMALALACGVLISVRPMAQTVLPAGIVAAQSDVLPSSDSNIHSALEPNGFPPESLPAQIPRVTATGVIQPTVNVSATPNASIVSTLPTGPSTPSSSTPSSSTPSISAAAMPVPVRASIVAVAQPQSSQAGMPSSAPLTTPIAVAPIPANSTLSTVAQPIAPTRKVGHARIVALPVRFNDDGATLTPPDLSGYLEQSAKLEQIESDQLALQQLALWQAQQDSVVQRHSSQPAPVKTASTKMATPMRPYLVDLTGVGNDLQARVMVPGYGETIVRAGQVLPNHWQIDAIDDDGVSYRTGPGRPPQRIVYQSQDAEAIVAQQLPDMDKRDSTQDLTRTTEHATQSGLADSDRIPRQTAHPIVSPVSVDHAAQVDRRAYLPVQANKG